MTKLHKIYLIVSIVLILGLLYLAHAYSVKQAAAEATQTATEKALADRDKTIAQRERDYQDFKAQMLQQIADIKTAKQGIQILQPIISPQGQAPPQTITKADLSPDAQKAVPGPLNTNLHLFTDEQVINQAKREVSCQITEAGLSKCGQDKADMQAKIDALTKANLEWAKLGVTPRMMVGFGVAKSAENGYTPAILFHYRIQPKLGLGVFAENRAVGGMVTVHFGSTPK